MNNNLYNDFNKDLTRLKKPNFNDYLKKTSQIDPSQIGSGTISGNLEVASGGLQSSNFKTGDSGWKISADGTVEFSGGVFRGDIRFGGYITTVDTLAEIQPSLDLTALEGGGIVYVTPGTYTLTADINIPSGVTLAGTSRDNCIFECGNYKISMSGNNPYSTGTVSINNGSTTLTGAGGATFTAAMVGRSIWLDMYWYKINTFTDATHLEIDTYDGENLAGSAYMIANIKEIPVIATITIQNAVGTALEANYVNNPQIKDLNVYDSGIGIEFKYTLWPEVLSYNTGNGVNLDADYITGPYIDYSSFDYSTSGDGATFSNSEAALIFTSTMDGNTGAGLKLTNCKDFVILDCGMSENGTYGSELVSSCTTNHFSNCACDGNGSDGIKLTATSDLNTIAETGIYNNGGYGINIANANCDNNVVSSCVFDNNTSGEFYNVGTNTSIIRKEIRVGSVASSATPSINTDLYNRYSITALAANITSVTITGNPENFQELIIRIKDNGTARSIAWGASFEAKGVALPTTTVISKVLTVKFIYDTVTSKWGCVAYINEA